MSSLGLGLPVTWLSHQCPHRKGNSLFLKARRCSCDSPRVFLRHCFRCGQAGHVLPSESLTSGSASSSAHPSAGSRGSSPWTGSAGAGDALWRMLSLAAHRAQIPRDTLFFKLLDHYFTIWCWFCHASAWIGHVCHMPSL